jgi:hypothetical protein
MFGKLALLQAIVSSRAASAPRRLVHANDNRSSARPCGPPPRMQRRTLLCRWQPATGGGRLECRWSIELVDATPAEEPQRRRTIGPSGHSIDSPKEVDNAHHLRGQVRPRPRAPLGRTRSFSARDLYPAPFHLPLRTAHGPSRCSSCGAVRGEISGALSSALGIWTQAARRSQGTPVGAIAHDNAHRTSGD